MAGVEGRHSDDGVPIVLFLCVHNAGRSQMALGWFNRLAGGRAVAWSGGSAPSTEINPSAIEVMREVGIDIAGEFPKPWTHEILRAADVVVTMGCGDACPIFPGKRYEDWELDDPAGRDVDAVRPVRDEIGHRVRISSSASRCPSGDGRRRDGEVGRAAGGRARGAGRARAARDRRRSPRSDRTPSVLAARHGLAGNLLAHHLDVLERVGLIDRHVSAGDRRRRYVRLRHDALRDVASIGRPRTGRALFICTHNSARSQLAAAVE